MLRHRPYVAVAAALAYLQSCLFMQGDMLVRPGFLEAAVWRKLSLYNVGHHVMVAYMKVGSAAWPAVSDRAASEQSAVGNRDIKPGLCTHVQPTCLLAVLLGSD